VLYQAFRAKAHLSDFIAKDRSEFEPGEERMGFEREVNRIEQGYTELRERVEAMIGDDLFSEAQVVFIRELHPAGGRAGLAEGSTAR
jgi:hypothetical protein